MLASHFWRSALLLLTAVVCLPTYGVTLTNETRIEVNDPSGDFSWKPANGALTASLWFKLAIPTDAILTENMTILVDRRGGSESDPHSYQFRFNIQTGNIEFTTRGSIGLLTGTMIEHPFGDRSYHLAVVRQNRLAVIDSYCYCIIHTTHDLQT